MEFSGKATTTIDSQGRIRIPAKFRKIIEKDSESEVFVTAPDSKSISIYPMAEWKKIMNALGEKSDESNLRRFATLAARWGKKKRMDKRGRIMIDRKLMMKTKIQGRIIIEGRENHLRLKKLSKD